MYVFDKGISALRLSELALKSVLSAQYSEIVSKRPFLILLCTFSDIFLLIVNVNLTTHYYLTTISKTDIKKIPVHP